MNAASQKKKGYSNKDSWLEKVRKQRPGIKREFENLPNPLDQVQLQLHKGCLGTIEREKYEGSFDHQKMIFLLKKLVFLYSL